MKNKILEAIDLAETGISKNERIRLEKRIKKLIWSERIDSFKRGYEACDFERNFKADAISGGSK